MTIALDVNDADALSNSLRWLLATETVVLDAARLYPSLELLLFFLLVFLNRLCECSATADELKNVVPIDW